MPVFVEECIREESLSSMFPKSFFFFFLLCRVEWNIWPRETSITLLTIKQKEGAVSGRNGMGLAGRNEKSYQLLTHLLPPLVWQRGLQSPRLTKHSSMESSLSEKLHHGEDEHKASVFSSFFFFLENPFKAASCVYSAASPCHSHTRTRAHSIQMGRSPLCEHCNYDWDMFCLSKKKKNEWGEQGGLGALDKEFNNEALLLKSFSQSSAWKSRTGRDR